MRFLLPLVCFIALVDSARSQVEPTPPPDTWLTTIASNWTAPQKPHPAVARIVVPEREGVAFGSGTLVDVNSYYGLVITNWHVVEAAKGQITVQFPDGFRSPGEVLKTDRDWDLAALRIQKPNVQPVRLSPKAPALGETLSIAGYGSGNYRAVSGRCTQYVAPGANLPFEMVELSAGARQGDSGGPIFNTSGQLAGVLFGESSGKTSGSYCGRVHLFLASLPRDMAASPSAAPAPIYNSPAYNSPPVRTDPFAIARSGPPPVPHAPVAQPAPFEVSAAFISHQPRQPTVPQVVHTPVQPPANASNQGWKPTNRFARPAPAAESASAPSLMLTSWQQVAGESIWDQAKTSLAIFGAMSILVQGMRLTRSKPKPRSGE